MPIPAAPQFEILTLESFFSYLVLGTFTQSEIAVALEVLLIFQTLRSSSTF